MLEFMKKNKEIIIKIISYLIVTFTLLYAMLPMIIFRGDYVFTIHDGLDSFGGVVQQVHDKGIYFHLNRGIDFNTADLSEYYYGLPYDAYTFLCCVFGLINGQIINRIVGTLLGFFSFRALLKFVFKNTSVMHNCCILLCSAAYVVTPISPNRTIAFGALPLVVLLFLQLREKKSYTHLCILTIFIPFFSNFTATLIFVLGFWLLFTIVQSIIDKQLNKNLCIGFVLMCVFTLILYQYVITVSLGDNSRPLTAQLASGNFWELFKSYLLDGQYHSSGLHGYLLLPSLMLLTCWMIMYFLENRSTIGRDFIISSAFVATGWLLWILSAFLLSIKEAGFKTGLSLIDGFSWGRLVGFMRPMWYIMIIATLVYRPKEKLYKNNITGALVGGTLSICIWYGIRKLLGGEVTGVLIGNEIHVFRIMELFFIIFSVFVFTSYRNKQFAIYILICAQICYVMISSAMYNDTGITLKSKITKDDSNASITLNEFYSKELFDEIKDDINYDGELVSAFGYHPAILQYNGFNTIDRYVSVHSMKIQNEFREIIAPALDKYPYFQSYYDYWGGRMYLFGEFGYESLRQKDIGEHPLYIDTNAFKKYGGVYILSSVPISNTNEIGISLVNDYEVDDMLYHIYVYKAN